MKVSLRAIALSVTCILGLGVQLAAALPTPDRNGDYPIPRSPRAGGPPGQLNWVVVDSDPKGLNCRMAKQFQPYVVDGADAPSDLYLQNVHNISQWDVVFAFSKGQRLQAVTGNMGRNQIMLTDNRGLTWLPISVQKNGRYMNCFVRANNRFIRPIQEDQFGRPL